MTRPHSILVIDDDRELRSLVSGFLARHGFRVETEASGGASPWRRRAFDLVVLDLMLPGEDGISVCRRIRKESAVPIIMLTALDAEIDRVSGLEAGADDYVSKPFSPRELLARVRAVLRRVENDVAVEDGRGGVYGFEGWTLDASRRVLRDPGGGAVALTAGEFDLLAALARHAERALSRDRLMDILHGREAGPFDRSIDVQISRLRRKLERSPGGEGLIMTVRNRGYVLAAQVTRS